MIVADTNTIVYALTPQSKAAEAAREVLRRDADWWAPPLWRSEFRNVLWQMMRREGLTLKDALLTFGTASAMVGDRDVGRLPERILRLARDSDCTPCDCEFVALALESHCPLVTSDRRLLKAFPDCAVSPSDFIAAHP